MILSVLAFEFVHSELDMVKYDSECHSEHDFCSLVEGVSINAVSQQQIEVKKYFTPLIFNLVEEFNSYSFRNNLYRKNIHLYSTPKDLYIINSSLLI